MLLRGDPADARMAGIGRKHQAAGHGFGPAWGPEPKTGPGAPSDSGNTT
jgi:hypothetical protein